MSAPMSRRATKAPFTVACARNIHRAVSCRSPEAGGLTRWLDENAARFHLPPDALAQDWPSPRHQRGVGAEPWRAVGAALARTSSFRADDTIGCWVARLADRLSLDAIETAILTLALHYRLCPQFEQLHDAISKSWDRAGRLTIDPDLIGLLLGVAPAEVATRLSGGAKLLAAGLLVFDRHADLAACERLIALLRRATPPGADIYDQLLGACTGEVLDWAAFSHLGQEAEVALALLRAALATHEPGVNILLHGPPGTGKTSLAATLAAQTGARLRPVAEATDDGDEPTRQTRLGGLQLAQSLAEPGHAVLLFDEAEDLFADYVRSDEPRQSRVFIHRLLERMAVPVIWTANSIEPLGPAVLRRMTMCLELRVPSLATRTVLWRRLGASHGIDLDEQDAARLARLVPAAPAVAATALRATRLAGGGTATTRLIVEGVARAMRGGGLPAPEPDPDERYDPEMVNADCDLPALEADLLRAGTPAAVSLLLSGPSGTGKSAWARHLARRMGLPVLHRRGSDLLDRYVGGTEERIARAFAEAREARAFLVFDEADSLLLERTDASRGWEISEVNEMLTWMESHDLPFACTTNLAARLDRASLRRFLIKLRFDFLTAAQARLAFQRVFRLPPPADLDGLHRLTPADFTLVRRRAALHGNGNHPGHLLRLLARESDGRGGQGRLGFPTAATK